MTDLNKIAHLRFAVAKKRGYPSWSDMYDWYSREGERPEVVAQLIEAACEEVLEAYISGLQDSGMVKALEYWKQRCEAAEAVLFTIESASDDNVIGKAFYYIKQLNNYSNWQQLVVDFAGINETKEK